jgi:hypothetical protein
MILLLTRVSNILTTAVLILQISQGPTSNPKPCDFFLCQIRASYSVGISNRDKRYFLRKTPSDQPTVQEPQYLMEVSGEILRRLQVRPY